MGTKSPYFDPEEPREVHPSVERWLARVAKGDAATFKLWRQRDGLVYKPAKIYVTFKTASGTDQEHDEWDADVNAALVRAGVRAESAKNEAQRMSLMLREAFTVIEREFGPGFFEGVLVEVLCASFPDAAVLVPLLRRLPVNPPYKAGRGYDACRAKIDATLREVAQSLMRDLTYGRSDAEGILIEALEQYLDERFHITERKMLGWS